MDMQTDQLLPPIRVVFDVSIKGAALKLVTVRSALLVENKLLEAMELRLDNTTLRSNDLQHLVIPSEQVIPVPLSYAWSKMTGKNMFLFCSKDQDRSCFNPKFTVLKQLFKKQWSNFNPVPEKLVKTKSSIVLNNCKISLKWIHNFNFLFFFALYFSPSCGH